MQQAIFFSANIRCGHCAMTIEQQLKKQLSGIESVQVNVPQRRIHVCWQNKSLTPESILASLSKQGYPAHPWQPLSYHHHDVEQRQALKRIFVAGMGMMQVMTYTVAIYVGVWQDMDAYWQHFFNLFSLLVTTPIVLYAGKPFFVGAWQAKKTNRMNMDVPVALAILLAFFASVYNTLMKQGTVYFDSVIMFIFFLLMGRFAEMRARYKTESATQAMALLLPETTFRIRENTIEEIPISAIQVKDQLLIKPGAAIPADGYVISGHSQVNEALLTGESLPKDKNLKDALIAGSMNGSDPLQMQVERIGNELFITTLLNLLEKAQGQKPKAAQLADQIAGHFILAILIASVVVGSLWWLIDPTQAFTAVLAILIVTCPCALSLATPAAIVTASGCLARQGLLITNPDALLKFNQITHVLLDKTGTLTQGQFKIIRTQLVEQSTDEKSCLALAAALENYSEHPLAKAFSDYLTPSIDATQLKSVAGVGLCGMINHQKYWIGQPQAIAQQLGIYLPTTPPAHSAAPTWLILACEEKLLAWFELHDPLRHDAQTVIEQLKKKNITAEIISGDLTTTVGAIAHTLKLDQFQGQITPQAKHALIQQRQKEGKIVAMIGDGVNDAPVLAQADVGIAMGQGTRIAQASADFILLGDSLSPLLAAWDIALKTKYIMQQNIAWAIGYNLLALPLAALGWISPWVAAIGMSASSLIVVLNALRLKHNTHSIVN